MKLKLQNISMSFSDKKILSQITMNIEEGEFVTILGPSGCGKSTILNILSGILHQDEGTVFVDDKEIKDLGEHFAYMPQEDLLLPWKTILDNVCLYGILHKEKKQARAKALQLLPVSDWKAMKTPILMSYPAECASVPLFCALL